MARLKPISPDVASGKAKDLYTIIEGRLGVVPGMMQTMANSPAFLKGYLSLGDALAAGTIGSRVSELIALTIAETNGCDYCLAAHTYLGTNLVKIENHVMEAARSAESADSKTDAILKFAKIVTEKKGQVSDADLAAARQASVTDGEISEIIGHVALNVLTNYFNIVAKTEIDFPVVESGIAAVA